MVAGLPNEIWLEIFSHLSFHDLTKVIPNVCTTFERIVMYTAGAHVETGGEWRQFHSVGSVLLCQSNGGEVSEIVKRHGRTLRHVEIRKGWDYYFNPTRGEDEEEALYRCPRLCSLSGDVSVRCIPEANCITRIYITTPFSDTDLQDLIQKVSHLREFIMNIKTGKVSDVGISRLANLTRFELHGGSTIIGDAGIRCVIVKSKITRFVLTGVFPGVTSATMSHLRIRGISLDYFAIDHKLVVSPMLRAIGFKLRTIRCILFKEVVAALADGACPQLETLDMGPVLITRRDMAKLTSGCPRLRDISGDFFTDPMIETIVAAYPSCTLRVRAPQQAAYARWRGYPGLSLIEA